MNKATITRLCSMLLILSVIAWVITYMEVDSNKESSIKIAYFMI